MGALVLLAVGLLPLLAAPLPVRAGELTRADLERRFPPPLRVAEQLRELHAWPLTSELEPDAGPVAYAFESIDLAPIPGFEGTPFNLLIAIDRQGRFLDVEVLRQHEPVFLGGLGPQPLFEFVKQYAGRSLRQNITIGSGYGSRGATGERSGAGAGGNERVVLDGVTKATASVRIVNQTVLAAAHSVARAKLGFAERKTKRAPPAQPREDGGPALAFPALLTGGYVAKLRLSNRDADRLFEGTEVADADEAARRDPDGLYGEVFIAYLNSPTIGRALLGDAAYAKLRASLYHGQHIYWIGSAGRHELLEENFVPGTSPARLRLAQEGLPIELRDFGGDDLKPAAVSAALAGQPAALAAGQAPGPPSGENTGPGTGPSTNASNGPDSTQGLRPSSGLRFGRVFQVEAHAGLDPGRPLELQVLLARQRGMILPQVTERVATLKYAPPSELFIYPPTPLPEWLVAWQARWLELAVLTIALAALCLALTRPRLIAGHLRKARTAWLLFVLVFVGWYAQGQLSIVQITGAIKTVVSGYDLSSFLYDPISLLLIAFLPVSFVLWGRGPFCGWLCPFGALQELISQVARRLHVHQRHLPPRLARGLDRGRFVLLAVLVVAAAAVPAAAERLVEVEPFKTAITVGFDRAWPFVAYAVGVLLAGAVVYKFFCRYLCPLGAFMELGGLLRRRGWLKRRPECGKPCQVCRRACRYDAIEKTGEIDYRRCHQCLDCVAIHDDPKRCVPLIRMQRNAARGAAA